MATKPIKTDLFRFVTLRTPQLINEQKKDLGFIFHPDKSKSAFLSGITDEVTLDKARRRVQQVATTFGNPFKTYAEVKALDSDMYNFSSWLMNNRNTITLEDIDQAIVGVTPLSEANLIKIWDNLYYQVITRKSSYVRQACIQLIMANNFIAICENYTVKRYVVPKETFIKRLANAKVVIDKAFTVAEKEIVSNVGSNKAIANTIEREIKQELAQEEIVELNLLKTELAIAQKIYDKAFIAAQESARAEYESTIAPLRGAAVKKQKRLQQEEYDLAFKQEREPREIPLELELPNFEFTFDDPFDKKYLKNLSDTSFDLVKELNLKDQDTISDAIIDVDNVIADANADLFNNTDTTSTTVYVGGSPVQTNPDINLKPFCFFVNTLNKRKKGLFSPLENYVYFTINLGNTGLFVTSETHTIQYGSSATITSTATLPTITTANYFRIRLFIDKTLTISTPFYTLNGELTLNDGSKVIYSATVQTKQMYNGCGVHSGGVVEPEPIVEPELYGISKVGIADFRRVEQEVCCYVPGQVSHIENVMAKEYKERATRNLTSIERTTESTSETEIENLTDTTSTERNEMQSEVTSTLTEDQSSAFGASAGVNGKFPSGTYHAEGYADFANSSSASQSNSNAQTYAQEITERTLERIVQKTTKKRTSRILKEFEENNKHGFDNRDGVQHVSGVYRWIDIIYKNQLVNYGKRLMYEFMLPEPSNFFKDAIYKDVENNTTSCNGINVFTKPKAPSELSINSAINITIGNYQMLASVYNIEVEAPPSASIWKSKGFAQPGPGGGSEEIEVPEGYYLTQAHGWVSQHGGGSDGYSGWAVGARGVRTNDAVHYMFFIYNSIEYLEKVSVSAYFRTEETDAGNIDINLKFVRGEKALNIWKNKIYKDILEAYEALLERYNESLLLACQEKQLNETPDQEKITFNPLFNRAIEKRELKRIAIEMLSKPFENPMGQDNYAKENECVQPVNQNADFENHAAHVKFFEQAFDWEIMAYLFYPYYWAKSCDWKDLIQQTDAADPIFQAFLQSGMARAVVPVRPGFEEAVTYYMETGDIWNGGDLVLDNEDDLYISIAEELEIIEGAVEDEWETRVPTALTIIQKDTVGLNEEGLPCCDFVLNNPDGDDFTNPLGHETAQLGVPEETTDTPPAP